MASLIKRGKKYYAQYYIGGKPRRVSLKTTSIQVAKEKVRQIESAMLRQDDIPIPTRTRKVFGRVCDGLKAKRLRWLTFRTISRRCESFPTARSPKKHDPKASRCGFRKK